MHAYTHTHIIHIYVHKYAYIPFPNKASQPSNKPYQQPRKIATLLSPSDVSVKVGIIRKHKKPLLFYTFPSNPT